MGAGVQASEVYAAADAKSLVVVGGDCPTVGLAGGFTQGGGHSPLSSTYGMGADQTLEWEVVDGSGQLLRASKTENADIYWALSGGGGGTYGVVYSLISKAHKDGPVTGATLNYTTAGISSDTYWDSIQFFHSLLTNLTGAGGASAHHITDTAFSIEPLTFPGLSVAQVTALLKPYTDYLKHLDVVYNMTITEYPGFLSEYNALFPPVPVEKYQFGGALIQNLS